MIKWPDLKFPINLWSAPRQEIDYMRKELNDIEISIALEKLGAIQHQAFIELQISIKNIAEKRIKELEFIYYTRTGKFPK